MSAECMGICERYKAVITHKLGNRRYIKGHKRCTVCSIWLVFDGFKCPCCKTLLRFRPRQKENKEYYRQVMNNS